MLCAVVGSKICGRKLHGKCVTLKIHIKIAHLQEIRTPCIRGMPATIRHRVFFPSSVLCKNINIKIHRPIIFHIVFVAYGRETWCLTLREDHTAEGVRE